LDQFRRLKGVRDWPMAAKVMAALTLTLLPPGIVAVAAALRNYNSAVAHGASTRLGVAQAATIALPVVMWLAALLIGWLVANSLIVRPLTRIRTVVDQYRKGDKSVRLGKRSFFSREVGALAEAFDALADDIDTHDAEIDAALAEQQRLTREVHHRVKNNLQIVSSLLSIQARDAASRDVAQAYAVIQSRVSALAIVHRWMYESDSPGGGGQHVDLKALTTDLAAGLEQSLTASEGVAVALTATIERLFVGQDTAVPLAFLITELVSCGARLAAPGPLAATIAAAGSDGHATLVVAAPVFAGENPLAARTGHPSSRIIAGMARQLRVPLVHDAAAGSYSIRFPLPAPPAL